MKVASFEVVYARYPSFLGIKYTKINSAKKAYTRTHYAYITNLGNLSTLKRLITRSSCS
ncbi:hypothetical protein LPIBR_200003 [Lacticaseibacillus paracasei]|nr:hypothetical protein LPIBR_200003 [Lacticaseibacillus paracasei]